MAQSLSVSISVLLLNCVLQVLVSYGQGRFDGSEIYSETSEQRTRWGQYKLTCFVPCRKVVLFSEVQIVLLVYIGKQKFWVP